MGQDFMNVPMDILTGLDIMVSRNSYTKIAASPDPDLLLFYLEDNSILCPDHRSTGDTGLDRRLINWKY